MSALRSIALYSKQLTLVRVLRLVRPILHYSLFYGFGLARLAALPAAKVAFVFR
jgi:hypothetical protein